MVVLEVRDMKKALLLSLVLLAGAINAVSFSVYSESPGYEKGSVLRVFADIENDGEEAFSGTILSSLTGNGGKSDAVVPHEVILDPGERVTVAIYEFSVTDDYPPGEYEVSATLYSRGAPAGYGEDTFIISGTAMDMDAWLLSCTDSGCANESSMFLLGETAYVGAGSTVGGVSCTATVISPSGKASNVALPAQLLLDEEGTYLVNSVCTKEGYNPRTPSLMLGAMEEWPQVKLIQTCNEDGICDDGENISNCPQDCTPQEQVEPEEDTGLWLIGAFILIVLAFIIYYVVVKK
jgi:hypothetical protein